jgi:hypothetical protein
MELVCQPAFGQLIITDSHEHRLKNIFDGLEIDLPVFQIADSSVKKSAMSLDDSDVEAGISHSSK